MQSLWLTVHRIEGSKMILNGATSCGGPSASRAVQRPLQEGDRRKHYKKKKKDSKEEKQILRNRNE